MSKKSKRQRILTNRDFPNEGFEFIETETIDGKDYLYWRCGETIGGIKAEGCFPVSVDFVRERFNELGRTYQTTGREIWITHLPNMTQAVLKPVEHV